MLHHQQLDPDLKQIVDWILLKEQPNRDIVMAWSADSKAIIKHFERLVIDNNGLLCRRFVNINAPDTLQVIMPQSLRQQFLQDLHISTGHLGQARLEAAVRCRAFWPGWTTDVLKTLQQCHQCAAYYRGQPAHRLPM